MSTSFGPAGVTTETSMTVALDKAASALPNLLVRDREYEWGVLLVQTDPYQRIGLISNRHRFFFGNAPSGGGGGDSGGGGGGGSSSGGGDGGNSGGDGDDDEGPRGD